MNMDYYKMKPEELEEWMISEERHYWADEEPYKYPFDLPDHYETGDELPPLEKSLDYAMPNEFQGIFESQFSN